jgi:hypothetical protein
VAQLVSSIAPARAAQIPVVASLLIVFLLVVGAAGMR